MRGRFPEGVALAWIGGGVGLMEGVVMVYMFWSYLGSQDTSRVNALESRILSL